MIAVLAEKPSVAREVAALLGATDKKDGYFEGNGYAVTWAFGHLVTLAFPEVYGYKGFMQDALPILPKPFKLEQRQNDDKRQKRGNGNRSQLKIIGTLFKECKSIIVATDAGREGELIFRYIYDYLKCNTPFQRLWVSSLTETALKKGFDALKPGVDFDNLYYAARARSQADWLVGINATQALSIAAGSGIYSLGRVQTPTLALVCRRFLDHQGFTVKKYWAIALSHTKVFIEFQSLSVETWDDPKEAEDILSLISKRKTARVTSVIAKPVTENAPVLYDLTGLQKAANSKYGFTASETLEIAQQLYEKKFITYPRTGSKYVTEDLWVTIPDLIRQLEVLSPLKDAVAKLKFARLNRHIVNEAKVTDHHGLLVTEKIPSALSAKENMVYLMIAARLLEAVSEACKKEITAIELQVLSYAFSLKSSKVLEPGWRSVTSEFTDGDTESAVPELQEGDEIPVSEAKMLQKETCPPELYTEAGLLGAMEQAGKVVNDAELRKALQGTGLGTPATRASIIEALFQRSYIERKGKSLIPTGKGLKVYEVTKDKKIASVEMTAEWETMLTKIEEGSLENYFFEKEMEHYTSSITAELLAVKGLGENHPELYCPKCEKSHLVINDKLIKCADITCGWLQWRTVCGLHLSSVEIENLVKNKSTSLLKGLKSKAGKPFNARLVLDGKSAVTFSFER